MLKVAMIGSGGYAFELIKRIWQLPDKYELLAVSSNPNRKSAGKQACIERGVDIFSDVDQMLEDLKGKVQVIIVPTPIHTHRELAQKCIKAGFDVFLEKPPVATIQDLDALAACAKENDKRVAVMFQSLYTSIVSDLKKRLVSGEFGKIRRIKGVAAWSRGDDYFTRNGWVGKLKVNGDWVLDGTINNPLAHMLSNQLYFAGQSENEMGYPAEVTAELYSGHDIESEDTSSLRIVTDQEIELIFNASLCPESTIDPLNIIETEKATIYYSNFNMVNIVYSDGRKKQIIDESEQRIYMLERLHDLYVDGQQFPCSLDSCRPFTLAVNAAFESAEKIQRIKEKHVKRFEQGDTIKTVINQIDHILNVANNNAKLFSELGVEWAKKTPAYKVDGYSCFPAANSKFKM